MGQRTQIVQQHSTKPNIFFHQLIPNKYFFPIVEGHSTQIFTNNQNHNFYTQTLRFAPSFHKYKIDSNLTEINSDLVLSGDIFPNMQQAQHHLRNPEQEYQGLTHNLMDFSIQNSSNYRTNLEDSNQNVQTTFEIHPGGAHEIKNEIVESRYSSISTVDSRNSVAENANNSVIQGNMDCYEFDHNNNASQHNNIIPYPPQYFSQYQCNNFMMPGVDMANSDHSQAHMYNTHQQVAPSALSNLAYQHTHGNYFVDSVPNLPQNHNGPNNSDQRTLNLTQYNHIIQLNKNSYSCNLNNTTREKPTERSKGTIVASKILKKHSKGITNASTISNTATHKVSNSYNTQLYDFLEQKSGNPSNFYNNTMPTEKMEYNNKQANPETSIAKHATPLRTRKGFRKPIPITNDKEIEKVIYDATRREYTVFWVENDMIKYRAYQCKKYGKDKAHHLAKEFFDQKKKNL